MQKKTFSEPAKKSGGKQVGAVIPFSSEHLLREALRALLSRIPEVSLVQETHGSQEIGKDIIFYLAGGLGERILCSCVVKNAPLTGRSATSKNSALTILHQVEQSLLNPKKMEHGLEIYVQKVFVITPYDLSDSTINSIFGHIRDRAGKLEFIGGTRLFDLFRRYWPDFLADEFNIIREHLRSTTARLQQERPLQQLAISYHLGKPEQTITRYYVQPSFHQQLIAPELALQLRSIVYDQFRPIMTQRPIPEKREMQWVPVHPRRIYISLADVEQCKKRHESLKRILKFLVDWGYCAEASSQQLSEEFLSYLQLLTWLREEHTKVDSTNWKSTVQELSKNSALAELSAEETQQVSSEASKLKDQLGKALRQIQFDLDTARVIVNDIAVDGLIALADSRYRVAVKILDMYGVAPTGLFNLNRYIPSDEPAPLDEEDAPLQKTERRIDFPSDFLDNFKLSVLIVGAAGFGKTSFCRWNALNDAERLAKGVTNYVPAYFPLHEVARGELNSFESIFLEHIGQSALVSTENTGDLRAYRHLRLYLDGLDEIPNAEIRRQIVEIAEDGLKRWRNIQIVLTARDYIVGPWLSWLPKFHLSEFSPGQIQNLLSNWLDKNPAQQSAFNEQLQRTPSLEKVLKVPLLATLVILVFRLTGNLPSSRKRLYEIFVDLLNTGWDLAKGVQRGSKFGPVVKLAILKRLAYTAHQRRVRQFPSAMIRGAVRASLQGGWELDHLLDEIVQDGLIIRSGEEYSFSHLSFQEFLTALSLAGDPNSKRRSRILNEFLKGDNWWKEVLSFYLELSSNTPELSEWITEAAASHKNEQGEMAFVQSRLLLMHLRISFPELAL